MGGQEELMCIMCERELWGEHRELEREFFKPCKTCNKFPGASSEGTCYHCFAVGNTIDECPECAGKPWSEEFLEAKTKSKARTSCWSRSRAGKRTPLTSRLTHPSRRRVGPIKL
jgi:hypothetical protein